MFIFSLNKVFKTERIVVGIILQNVDYQYPVGSPTEATKGIPIYALVGIDFQQREELNIYGSKELETYFREALNKTGKNTCKVDGK